MPLVYTYSQKIQKSQIYSERRKESSGVKIQLYLTIHTAEYIS